MDFTHTPVFQRQVSQDSEHVFSTSFDTVDVMKKQLKESGHPNGMPIHFALQRNVYEANHTNLPLDLEQARLSNAKDMQIEIKVDLSRHILATMIDSAVGQLISRAAFALVRSTSPFF